MAGPQSIDAYLTPKARVDIAEAIAEAEGNEVFFVGSPGEDGRVDAIEVHCRGNAGAVPALKQVGRFGEAVIHNHPSGRLVPSEPDLALASHYGQEGVGFFIVNNDADAIYVVVERPKEGPGPIELDGVSSAFLEGLPRILRGHEPRAQQIDMARTVAQGQNEGRVTVVEAGTGTGKSLAYLIPSAMRALANGERIAIATRTRHLQHQLLHADVPLVRQLLPELQVAILKGRGNYLCRRKLEDRLKEADPDAAERHFLLQVRDWVDVTRHGDLDDLPFVPDRELWELVQSNSEHTLRVRCPHYDECFYYRSRRRAAQANIVIANHHLLMADLSLRAEGVATGLLPRYEHLVLDEAHHLEDVATEFSGQSVTTLGLLRHLGRIRPVRGRRKGLAVRLRMAVEDLDASDDKDDAVASLDRLLEHTEACRATLRLQIEDIAFNLLEASGRSSDPQPENDPRRKRRPPVLYRLTDDLEQKDPVLHRILSERVDALARALSDVAKEIESVVDALETLPERFRRAHLQTRMDLTSVSRRLVDATGALGALLKPDGNRVRWVEVRFGNDDMPDPRFMVRPIEAADVVKGLVLPGAKSITLTSATLSVAGSFDHYVTRNGLDAAKSLHTQAIPSPFDYPRQVWVGVPSDMPEPRDRGYEGAVVEAVTEAIRIAGGRTFVLFTSYRMLHRVADRVGRALGGRFSILRQGDLPRERLLEVFKARQRCALFGTDSFWEGVDVRGEALSCVILPRLPFRVPSEPVQVARAEKIEARGGSAFSDLSVPQAVLKFRQGFGRLVRHRSDRGVVLVLDARIIRKGYGRSFVRSLPEGVHPHVAPLPGILEGMADFLAAGREDA